MDGVSIGYCECRRIIAFDFLFITSFNCLLEQLVGRDACQREIQDFEDKTKTFGKLSGQSAGSAFLTSKLCHHGPDRTALKKLCLDHRLACVVLPRADVIDPPHDTMNYWGGSFFCVSRSPASQLTKDTQLLSNQYLHPFPQFRQ